MIAFTILLACHFMAFHTIFDALLATHFKPFWARCTSLGFGSRFFGPLAFGLFLHLILTSTLFFQRSGLLLAAKIDPASEKQAVVKCCGMLLLVAFGGMQLLDVFCC